MQIRPALIFLFLLSLFFNIHAQPTNQWINYSKDYIFYDIDFDGDDVWISTMGGLVKLNQPSGTTHVFTGSNSGITSSQINNVHVAKNGDKWICTAYGGIVKYDNVNWEKFFILPSGDTIAQTFDVDEDPAGNIWFSAFAGSNVGGLTGGNSVYRYDGSTFQKFSTPNQYYSRDLECDSSGNVWGIFNNYLYRFDGVSWLIYDSTNSSYTGKAYEIEIDQNNVLWIVTLLNNVCYLTRYDGITFTNTLIPVQTQRLITVDENNQLLVFGHGGISSYDGVSFTPVTGLPYSNVGMAARDSAGNIFAGFWTSADTMFYKYDPAVNNWTGYFTSNSRLLSNYGRTICIDHQDNRWMATNTGRGLARFDGTTWTIFSPNNSGIPSENVSSVFEDSNHNLWVGFSNSGPSTPLAKFDGTIWEHFTLAGFNSSGSNYVFDITEDANGAIWVSTVSGIARYYQGTWTYYLDASLPTITNMMYVIKSDMNNTLWAVPNQEGIIRLDGANWVALNTSNSGLASNDVYDITFDGNNNLWLATFGGLIQKFDGNTWTTYPASVTGITGFGAFDVQYNHIDGTLWLSTPMELIKYDGASWQRFDLLNSGICSGVYKTIIDRYNNKWLVTQMTGFVVFNESGINYETILNVPKNKIRGKVYYDTNGNGTYDGAMENLLSARKVLLLPDSAITFTNSAGQYTFKRDSGLYDVSYIPDSLWLISSNPSNYQITLSNTDIDTLDFGTAYAGFENTAMITCVALSGRCDTEVSHLINYRNEGTTILNGEILYVLDSLLTYVSASPAPDVVSGDTLIWSYSNLLHFEERQIAVRLLNPDFQSTGDTVICHATIYQNQNPINSDTAYTVILCSFDPNDKQVFPYGQGPNHEVLAGTPLKYTIRFQNMGNDTAFYVLILDTLDSDLEFSTFELLSSSHPVNAELKPNGVVRFSFENINLLWSNFNEPASHGFVKYRIAPKSGLSLPRIISNEAYIYFDFNPYILTNEVTSTIVSSYTGVDHDYSSSEMLQIYPNPSAGEFKVVLPKNSEGLLELIDSGGRLVSSLRTIGRNEFHHFKNIPSGFYILRFQTENGQVYFNKVVSFSTQ